MIEKISLLLSPYHDPYVNLAIENYFLEHINVGEKVLFFYTNRPAIVLGRFQNPWLECDLLQMREKDVCMVRRQSGGGTVYHDKKNLNFCFIDSMRKFDKAQNNNLLIESLRRLNIEAYASERSDLVVNKQGEAYKFSGSAFKQKKNASFHHGTLLIDTDLEILNDILKSKQEIESSSSIKSVRSKVMNLKKLNPLLNVELLIDAIAESFRDFFNIEIESIAFEDYFIDQHFFKKISSWDWIYGETPKFTLVQDQIELELKKGKIINLSWRDDRVHPIFTQAVCQHFNNLELKRKALDQVIESLVGEYPSERNLLFELKEELIKSELFSVVVN